MTSLPSPSKLLRKLQTPKLLQRKPKEQTARVLKYLLESPDWTHGYKLSKEAQLSHASVYAIVQRLMDDELIVQEWDTSGERPRNKFKLNATGLSAAREALKNYHEGEAEKLRPSRAAS